MTLTGRTALKAVTTGQIQASVAMCHTSPCCQINTSSVAVRIT